MAKHRREVFHLCPHQRLNWAEAPSYHDNAFRDEFGNGWQQVDENTAKRMTNKGP